jgi:cyclophilin family peptidyl-prolyl cis-trans isomerase
MARSWLEKIKALPREENPVVFLEVATTGISPTTGRKFCDARVLGRLYFELRQDIAPIACANFLQLVLGTVGKTRAATEPGFEDVYRYKGTRLHRIVRNQIVEGGDLRGTDGEFNQSGFPVTLENPEGTFPDENFILRHTGPGCLSYCSRGPDTNGCLFQITLMQNEQLDERCVCFGCLVTKESFDVLEDINSFGTKFGMPLADVYISDTGKVFPRA